jgi:dienelactone hydrolase
MLSITTFLIVYTPFEIYFSFRDLWFDRWPKLYHKDLKVSKVKINFADGFLSANLVKNQNQAKTKLKNAIVIVCHGFSDTKETLEYFYYPLAYQGYVVIAYDARGTGKSKKTGHRSNFIKRIEDFNYIIKWIKSDDNFSKLKIYCIGFSVGALTVLAGGFQNKDVEKIIAISSMSYYKQNIPKFNPIIALSYLMKGVKLFPSNEENKKLSPYLIIEKVKNNSPPDQWKKYSKRVMLIHCKNDRVIKYRNFKENALILEATKENSLILAKGGHSQKKNELTLVGATLRFLNFKNSED